MSNRDYLEENIERLMQAVEPELKLPEDKARMIHKAVMEQADVLSARKKSSGAPKRLMFKFAAAAAAVVIVAGMVWLSVLALTSGRERSDIIAEDIPSRQEPDRTEQVKQPESVEREVAEAEEKLGPEIAMVFKMGEVEDVEGLLGVLEDGPYLCKLVAANFLGKFAGQEAIEPLEKASAGWTGEESENWFLAAKKQIEQRLGITPESAETEGQQVKSARQAKQFAARGVLSGIISDVDSDGPVAGAKVKISGQRLYEVYSDPNGFYCFEEIEQDGDYRIEIVSTEYLWISSWSEMPVVKLQQGVNTVKHFELKRGCVFDVEVVDEKDEPVEGVDFYVNWMGQQFGRENERMRQYPASDKQGRARLGAFEPSETGYLITAVHPDYAYGKYVAQFSEYDRVYSGRIVLQKGVTVAGYAEYEDGSPAEGLSVIAKPVWWNSTRSPEYALIDENGYFTLRHIVPALYSIEIFTPNPNTGGGTSNQIAQMQLPPEEDLLMLKISGKSPSSLVSISGTIEYQGKSDMAYMMDIFVSSASGLTKSVSTTTGQKEFVVDSLEPGVYKLVFNSANIEQKVIENVEAPASGLHVELSYLSHPVIHGIVSAADTAQPVTKFKVRARQLESYARTGFVQEDRWSEFNSPQGQFEIKTIGAGSYQVQVAAEGYAWWWSDEIDTDGGEPVAVALVRGGRVEGTVTDDSGKKITGAKVFPLSRACGNASYTIDKFVSEAGAVETADGAFVIENLSPGSETLKVVHPDYCFAIERDIPVFDGLTTGGIKVVLDRGASVSGYVYDSQARPMPNVTLYVQDAPGYMFTGDEKAGRLAAVVTDEKGAYTADKLPERMCYIVRRGVMEGVSVTAVVPNKQQKRTVNFGGSPFVTGRVVIDGNALANTQLVLSDPFNSSPSIFGCYSMTDSMGHFSFGSVSAGRYSIYYRIDQSSYEWLRLATFEAGGEDMDIGEIGGNTGRVVATVKAEDPNQLGSGFGVELQQGVSSWGTKAGVVSNPDSPQGPYTISGVPAGQYVLVVSRNDGVKFRKTVVVEQGGQDVQVEINIPKGDCTIEGAITGGLNDVPVLWGLDKSVSAWMIPRYRGYYKIENLPAGRYWISGPYTGDDYALQQFELRAGESMNLEVDVTAAAPAEMTGLYVQVIAETGKAFVGAQTRLEGFGRVYEPVRHSSSGDFFVAPPGQYTAYASFAGEGEKAVVVQVGRSGISEPAGADNTVIVELGR